MFIMQNDLIRTNTLIHVRDRYLEGMTQDVSRGLYGEIGQPNRNMYTVILLGVIVNNILRSRKFWRVPGREYQLTLLFMAPWVGFGCRGRLSLVP